MYIRVRGSIHILAIIVLIGACPVYAAEQPEPVLARLVKNGAGLQPVQLGSFSVTGKTNNSTFVVRASGAFVFSMLETPRETGTDIEIFMYPIEQDTYEFPKLNTGLIQSLEGGFYPNKVFKLTIHTSQSFFSYRYHLDAQRFTLALNAVENNGN